MLDFLTPTVFFTRQNLARCLRYFWLACVGLLGAGLTLWLCHEVEQQARVRLEQRFQKEAQERAELIARNFDVPMVQLQSVQRLFHSFDAIEWPVFEKFVTPLTGHNGVLGIAWAPRVLGVERAAFEHQVQSKWGESFVIRDFDADGHLVAAEERAEYYPLYFQTPVAHHAEFGGLDLYGFSNRKALIDRAIAAGVPVANSIGPSVISQWRNGKIVVLIAPVFKSGEIPEDLASRRVHVQGVISFAIDFGVLFDRANVLSPSGGLYVSLVDNDAPETPVLMWGDTEEGRASAQSKSTLSYARMFDFGEHLWTIRVTAGPRWEAVNVSNSVVWIQVAGALLTLCAMFLFARLLRRSALADTLAVANAEALSEQHKAELWAKKLSLLVEQSPASIVITDLDGRVEYVNEKFAQTTGYSRDEAFGQDVRLLVPSTGDEREKQKYRALWAALYAGERWEGEVQSVRRDGTRYWERVLVSAIKDHDGVPICYAGLKEDVSELRELLELFRESEGRLRAAMSVMFEGLAILSPEGRFLFANRAAEEILGRRDTGLQGVLPQDLPIERFHADGRPCPFEETPIAIALLEQREVRDALVGFRAADGVAIRWIQVNVALVKTDDAKRAGMVMTLSDITERRRNEEQLRLAYEAIRHSGEGVVVTDELHRIISVNPAFEILTGYQSAEVMGLRSQTIVSHQQSAEFSEALENSLVQTGRWQGEIQCRRKGGDVFPVWLGASVIHAHDGKAKYHLYILSDMTERQAAQQRIEFLAHHDALTELPNRVLLRDRAEQALALAHRNQTRMALLFLDLDRFKNINDSLGHPVGDALLKEVVDRLKACVRETDTISRQGGDEFILLLGDVRDGDAASRVADKIHQRMGEPFSLGEHVLQTSFSVGIAMYPEDGIDFDSLLQKADTAMYHAKEAGRGGYRFFTEEMNLKVVEHLTLENKLRRALENKEFVLYYQPQFDLAEDRIVGVEALIRWNSPEDGLVPPARFIPVAEESGLIVQIGAWVLGEACRQAREWQDAGLPPFSVAVNLSALQFRRPDLINNVINALVLSELDSQWLELELTESILIQETEATLDTVRRLKALGIKLSVDDFGTGYSSLAYLKRFAVDKLKIDQSFVRELVSDPDDAAIVRAIIQMAHSLKLKTIAEGVETRALADLLRLFHCDEAQGYFFAKPMPANELEAFVRAKLREERSRL